MQICQCGSCQSALERSAVLIKKMLAENECPVYAFAVSECMQMQASYLLMEMTAAHAKIPTELALVVNAGTEQSLRERIVADLRQNAKGATAILTELTLAYNDMVDRIVADKEAREKDAANIKTSKGD